MRVLLLFFTFLLSLLSCEQRFELKEKRKALESGKFDGDQKKQQKNPEPQTQADEGKANAPPVAKARSTEAAPAEASTELSPGRELTPSAEELQNPPQLPEKIPVQSRENGEAAKDPDDPKKAVSVGDVVRKSFRQRDSEAIRDLDLLFIVDTSTSLNEERKSIAQSVSSFVAELPKGSRYRVGVLLAHGPQSKHSARFFGSPAILDSESHYPKEIKDHLYRRLHNPPTESLTDGGEAGLLAFWKLLDRHQERALSFFRENAVLAVVFISDENAICAKYPPGVERAPEIPSENNEKPAFKLYCKGIDQFRLFDRVQALYKSRPFLLNAIVYLSDENIPPSSTEKEIGYGYLELPNLSGGELIELSSPSFSEGLAKIGELTRRKMQWIEEVFIEEKNILVDSIEVYVDGKRVKSVFSQTTQKLKFDEYGKAGSLIEITYRLESPDDPN